MCFLSLSAALFVVVMDDAFSLNTVAMLIKKTIDNLPSYPSIQHHIKGMLTCSTRNSVPQLSNHCLSSIKLICILRGVPVKCAKN